MKPKGINRGAVADSVNKGNSRPLFLDDKACDIFEIIYYGIAFIVGVKSQQFGLRAEKAATP